MPRTNKADNVTYLREYRDVRRATPYKDTGICRKCGVILSELNWLLCDYANKDMICEFCQKKDKARRHQNRRQAIRTVHRAWKYNLTPQELTDLINAQDNLCAICGQDEPRPGQPLSIDHDHQTGQVRGLLCSNCNRGLGLLKDSLEILEKACNYLKVGGLSRLAG